jgi:DNA invertase Pin-like site-specific DNA recombinase
MPRRKGGKQFTLAADRFKSVKDVLVPYRRVSTREQADKGAGLAAQETALTLGLKLRHQQALTWDCVDKGKSGKNMNREGLDQALKLVYAGEAGGIIVSKLDRLSRSLLDFAFLMAKADREGWNIVALDLNLDLRTPAGKMMAGILAVFAQFERDVISQRTKDGLAEKRAEGVRLGRPRLINDDLMAAILAMYHSSANYSATARWLNDHEVEPLQGGKMWYPNTVRNLVFSQDGKAFIEQLQEAA